MQVNHHADLSQAPTATRLVYLLWSSFLEGAPLCSAQAQPFCFSPTGSWLWGPVVTLQDCLAAFFARDELKGMIQAPLSENEMRITLMLPAWWGGVK